MPETNNNVGGFFTSLGKTAAGAAVGTLGDIAVSAVNAAYQKKQFEREVAQEQKTYERNRQDYLSDLENERAYNSASSQLSRLQEAGLNPNLMGSSSMSPGISSGATPMGNGTMTGIGPTTVGNGLGSGMIAMSTADVARSRAAAQNASDYAYAELQAELGMSEREFRPLKKALIKAQEAAERGQADLYNEQARLVIAQAAEQAIVNNNLQTEFDKKFAEIDSKINLNTTQGKFIAAQTIMTELQQAWQKVENDWQKAEHWRGMARDILSVIGQFVGFGVQLKVASKLAVKMLPQAQQGAFLNQIDDIIGQVTPPSGSTPNPFSSNRDIFMNDWSSMAPGL